MVYRQTPNLARNHGVSISGWSGFRLPTKVAQPTLF